MKTIFADFQTLQLLFLVNVFL